MTGRDFDPMEVEAVRALFRAYYRRWFSTHEAAAQKLADMHPVATAKETTAKQAKSWLEGHTVSRSEVVFFAGAALTIIAEHKDEILKLQGNAHSRAYIEDILALHRGIPVTPRPSLGAEDEKDKYASIIFSNWRNSVYSGPTNIVPGFYQIFRLYKPTRELSNVEELAGARKRKPSTEVQGSVIGNYGGPDLRNHVVICELVYVDPKSMEFVLITAERNKYIGTIYVNHEDILFGLLQRKTGNRHGVNQRFLCMKLVRADLAYHSGLMIKVGDSTARPLASEFLLVRIRKRLAEHRDLYQEIEQLRATAGDGERVPKDSVIARYVTPNPPAYSPYDPAALEWKDVKFVRDFPALLNLSKIQGNHPNKYRLLREPSRTLDQDVLTILGRQKDMALHPYRREDP